MIRRSLGLVVAYAIIRFAVRTAVLIGAAVAAALAMPASLVAAAAFGLAWLRGWQPRRLLIAAAWCVPMVVVWLTAIAITSRSDGWHTLAGAPYRAWVAFWNLETARHYARAMATIAPAAIPLGLLGGAAAWSYRISSLASGAGGLSPGSAVAFDQRQWRHQVRAARARIAAPGSVQLSTRRDLLAVGAVIRSIGHRAGPIAAIGYQRMRSHQVVIGTTGTGKTTLLLRLWAGFVAASLRRHAADLGPPPLLVVLDCKGGSDARRIADRVRRVLRDAGARTTAIWPDEATLTLWSLPPRQLTTTLVDLIEHGTGSAAYYVDVMEALIGLAVEAPCGPPASAADLLSRLEPGWLSLAYAASGTAADHAMLKSAAGHIGDVALRFRTLFRRLGSGLDGPGDFADADAWYCILEGTDQIPVAEGQARALVDLLSSFAARGQTRREILLAVDEFSAVSRRLPIWQLYERARSLGLAVQVSAQSWQGLAPTEDERNRIAASAEGGVWLLRTSHPEPVAALAGSRKVTQTVRRLRRFPIWAHQGSSRLHDVPVVDPDLIRRLDVGQAAYIYRAGVTYVQVKRLVAAPPEVAQAPHPSRHHAGPPQVSDQRADDQHADTPQPGTPQPGTRRVAAATLPDASPVLDAAFGPEQR